MRYVSSEREDEPKRRGATYEELAQAGQLHMQLVVLERQVSRHLDARLHRQPVETSVRVHSVARLGRDTSVQGGLVCVLRTLHGAC